MLGDSGEGTDSQVIAGMEWAAERADVVNMSLGGWEPSDGTDPMSLALDELTAKHGTLFVVAAGNDGPVDGAVSSPAAAASALTVGAVDRGDRLADFSSRGPWSTPVRPSLSWSRPASTSSRPAPRAPASAPSSTRVTPA
ncbi:S8 family serine peptidase [Catellatospora bangladeshensis]|uniref:S8 family serine peptidase n=1 Tax=Catellatospora bangladeshensis TaxID=310355 RepID=UPI00361B99F3